MTDEELGKIAFEAFRDYLQGTKQWDDIWGREREAWEAAAAMVAEAVHQPEVTEEGNR